MPGFGSHLRLRITAGLAAAALAASACGIAGAEPPRTELPSLETTLLPVVTKQMERMHIPGMLVSVQTPDRGSWQAALGVADTATRAPMNMADHMRVGSITKSFTATVILQLVQEGKLRLDDPLAPYFPDVDTNLATIRQALQLNSGVADYTTIRFLNALAENPQRVWSPEELIATVAGQPPMFQAGRGWYYSNTNYVMLGVIAERTTGESLSQLFAERIFTPLGMTGCSIPAPTDAVIPEPFSRGYQFGTDWGRPDSPPAPLPELIDVTDTNPSWGAGAGAAICTASDLAIWGRALATGELLDPAIQAQRLTFVAAGDPHAKYGLGIANINGLVGHNGQVGGYMCQTARRQSDGTIIVVLTNLTAAPDNGEPATVMSEAISRAIPTR